MTSSTSTRRPCSTTAIGWGHGRDWRGRRAVSDLRVIDATMIDDPVNADEMLAWCINYAFAGDVVAIHSDMCRTQLGVIEPCTCRPIALVLGARA